MLSLSDDTEAEVKIGSWVKLSESGLRWAIEGNLDQATEWRGRVTAERHGGFLIARGRGFQWVLKTDVQRAEEGDVERPHLREAIC